MQTVGSPQLDLKDPPTPHKNTHRKEIKMLLHLHIAIYAAYVWDLDETKIFKKVVLWPVARTGPASSTTALLKKKKKKSHNFDLEVYVLE